MQTLIFSANQTTTSLEYKSGGHASCPVCGGAMSAAGRENRCLRCGFALCEGCGGGGEMEIFPASPGNMS